MIAHFAKTLPFSAHGKQRILKTFLIFLALVSFALAQGTPANFNQLLTVEQLWALDQDAFQKATSGLPFRWTSKLRDSARAADAPGMTLFGRSVVEVIARFEKNKLSVIAANFYTRGDAGDLTEPAFKKLLTETTETLNKVTGVKSTVRGKDPTNAVKAEGIIWNTAKSQYLLEYSFTKCARKKKSSASSLPRSPSPPQARALSKVPCTSSATRPAATCGCTTCRWWIRARKATASSPAPSA